ncbi:hypothetical protein AMAG_15285 [Allomyces macrogynus ATCC 38327]|uniref:Uncharacterized protein n=1 Tax=Allomyces macrogynus (strain ATCC 38327) TaxID=578462 RepID=A0A0L0T915_ALLM3|nr:hypothetical protein AMAG_15285 [Allomyces macrogynus ATCC 38327]|eukprot:KNE71029.1 hypothetical protein AMAG_15285 [Allomyces macrogynus ATCC 38327]
MPATAVISREPVVAVPAVKPSDDFVAAHAAVFQSAKDGDKVNKDALVKLLAVISSQTKDVVSHDLILAHLVLLTTFHQQLRNADNEAKDLAHLCSAETRYLAFMDGLRKAIAIDASLVENPPLPPLDVAMIWHSHMLSPIRYADDVQRLFGPDMVQVAFPMMRLSQAITGINQDNLDTGRAFWAAHMPAGMPYDLTLADIDETKATGKIVCALCRVEQTLSMPEYAAFRLHGEKHTCTSCATSFTAEHAAVRRFLAKVARAPRLGMIAGMLQHPKTLEYVPKNTANAADLCKLFEKAIWKQHAATLPALPTWADVESKVLAPIMAAAAESLNLPGNRRRFALVVNAHRDVTTGPWSMDLVRAVRRQRRFSAKLTEHVVQRGCGAIHATVTEALAQYPKFLAMMAVRPTLALVPTTTIDLAWHTHQLAPAVYATQTRALTGRITNHDDSDDVESEEKIADSAKAMPDAWRAVFDEDYYCPKTWCTIGCTDWALAAADKTAHAKLANVASCYRNGNCIVGPIRPNDGGDAAEIAFCFRSGNCIVGPIRSNGTQVASCYRNGNCIVGPIRPNDGGDAAEIAFCFRSGNCIVGPIRSNGTQVASCYRNGNCIVGPIRPNNMQNAEVASCYRNGNCMVGP